MKAVSEVEGLRKTYGSVAAVDGVSFAVVAGLMVAAAAVAARAFRWE